MAKNKTRYTMDQITTYLRVKGVPSQMIYQIRMALAQDALTEADNVHWDRIFTSIASSLRKCFGFGPTRIMRCLQEVNDTMARVGDNEETWHEIMENLKNDVGIVVRTGGDDRLIIEVGIDERGSDEQEA